MDAEERVHNAISITRELLMDAFDHPMAIIRMTVDCTKPEDVENQVAMILEYLDRTDPKKASDDLGVDKIEEAGV
ncbi:MAG: hypothetical protein KKB59_18235 [Spirochaetes bacterium]|nr:hypothetical protein [Spirochaetota bacterium]